MMLAAIVMGSQVTLFAQEKKGAKSERRQFNKEQMLEIQCNQIRKGLALDEDVYKRQHEMILMKNLILILIFAAGGLNTMASNPVHVIITAGQSNTDGRTPVSYTHLIGV